MALDPSEFVAVANHLHTHQNPPSGSLRSAVSRGYYAVFLTIKQEVTSRSFTFPRHGAHGALLGALKATNDNHAIRLEKKISRLRRKREDADYELTRGDFEATEVGDIIERCRVLCDELRNSVPERLMVRIGEELEKRAN